MELFEDKIGVVSAEVKRQQQGDKIRETRADMSRSIGQLKGDVDKSIAQMNGKLNGLSDNLVSQIEHVSRIDDRFQKWRGQFEGELLMKVEQLERGHARLTTSHKCSSTQGEESLKKYQQRLLRLESAAEDRRLHGDQISEHIDILHQRLSDVEDTHKMVLDAPRPSAEAPVFGGHDLSRHLSLESRVDDVTSRLERLARESGDVQDIHALVAKHEQQLMAFRVQLNEHVLALSHRTQIGPDVDGRLRDLQRSVQSHQEHMTSHAEKFERLEDNVRHAEQNHEDLSERVLLQHRMGFPAAEASVSNGHAAADAHDSRLEGVGESLRDLDDRLRAVTLEAKMASDVGAKLEQLVPGSQLTTQVLNHKQKIVHQEQCVSEVIERVGKLEFDVRMLRPTGTTAGLPDADRPPTPVRGASAADGLGDRVAKLEAEVERLCFAVDGSSGPPELNGPD